MANDWKPSPVTMKQTGYNAAATVVSALATAGLLESREQAFSTLEEIAGKIYAELSGLTEDVPTKAASNGASRSQQSDNPGDIVFNFGRNDGKTIADVYRDDPEYLTWLTEQDSNSRRNWIRQKAQDFLDTVRAGV